MVLGLGFLGCSSGLGGLPAWVGVPLQMEGTLALSQAVAVPTTVTQTFPSGLPSEVVPIGVKGFATCAPVCMTVTSCPAVPPSRLLYQVPLR